MLPVTLPSYRVLSLWLVNGMRVWANVPWVVVRSIREPPKNHARSRSNGPPAVISWVGESLLARVVPALFSSGVSTLQAGLLKFDLNAPENRLPPLLVITLTTPPL